MYTQSLCTMSLRFVHSFFWNVLSSGKLECCSFLIPLGFLPIWLSSDECYPWQTMTFYKPLWDSSGACVSVLPHAMEWTLPPHQGSVQFVHLHLDFFLYISIWIFFYHCVTDGFFSALHFPLQLLTVSRCPEKREIRSSFDHRRKHIDYHWSFFSRVDLSALKNSTSSSAWLGILTSADATIFSL